VLFTIAKLWKQPRFPTTDEWIKKIWYLYTMEFYSAMKKNEILSFSSKWMELENIILSVTLKQQRPLWEGDWDVVKRSGRDESIWVVIHMCMEAMLGISLYSYPYLN
jgi:hypothetical protein